MKSDNFHLPRFIIGSVCLFCIYGASFSDASSDQVQEVMPPSPAKKFTDNYNHDRPIVKVNFLDSYDENISAADADTNGDSITEDQIAADANDHFDANGDRISNDFVFGNSDDFVTQKVGHCQQRRRSSTLSSGFSLLPQVGVVNRNLHKRSQSTNFATSFLLNVSLHDDDEKSDLEHSSSGKTPLKAFIEPDTPELHLEDDDDDVDYQNESHTEYVSQYIYVKFQMDQKRKLREQVGNHGKSASMTKSVNMIGTNGKNDKLVSTDPNQSKKNYESSFWHRIHSSYPAIFGMAISIVAVTMTLSLTFYLKFPFPLFK